MTQSDQVRIRRARLSDAQDIARFLRLMICDMEQVGGHTAAPVEAWGAIEKGVPDRLENESLLYLIAEVATVSVGFGEAKHSSLIPVFAPKSILHISSLYVLPENRGKGIGASILEKLLQWGRDRGCSEAELNVLAGNPARKLYTSAGFEDFEVRLKREL